MSNLISNLLLWLLVMATLCFPLFSCTTIWFSPFNWLLLLFTAWNFLLFPIDYQRLTQVYHCFGLVFGLSSACCPLLLAMQRDDCFSNPAATHQDCSAAMELARLLVPRRVFTLPAQVPMLHLRTALGPSAMTAYHLPQAWRSVVLVVRHGQACVGMQRSYPLLSRCLLKGHHSSGDLQRSHCSYDTFVLLFA